MTNQTHTPRLTVKLLDILTEAEKDALMHHRLQLRRRGTPRERKPNHEKTSAKKWK